MKAEFLIWTKLRQESGGTKSGNLKCQTGGASLAKSVHVLVTYCDGHWKCRNLLASSLRRPRTLVL